MGPSHSPDYFDQFTHVDMVWDKELGLVQHWQLFLPFIAFDDDLGRKSMVGLAAAHGVQALALRSNTNQTSTSGKVEVRPHFASPSQENKQKDMSSDHQVGCRQLFSRESSVRLSQAVESIQGK